MAESASPIRSLLRTALVRLTGERTARRGLRMIGLGMGLTLAIGLIGILVAVQITSTPNFCGTCHIMKPYYKSWQASRHNQIACVECHIPPGATAEIRKKYEALAMVAKYFTATYGTRLWTEVEDSACLRCHERRLLEGKEVFHGVTFDHTPHLTEARRGLKLRCTSCHSQIVQGSHIAVTVSTCALCHFKDQARNTNTGQCTTCHQIPNKVVKAPGGGSFDHGQVGRLGVDCRMCHENVVRGNGEVPRQNCLSCHSEPERLAKYSDTVFLHKMHVSTHKVDCQRCHLIVEHDRGTPPQQPASGSCAQCHGGGHSPQFQLYAGRGGRGVPAMPSAMYQVGVACQGCHVASLQGSPQPVSLSTAPRGHAVKSGAVACMTCHGPGYGAVFASWKVGVGDRVAALGAQMETTSRALGQSTSATWADAQANFLLVREGNGMHNVPFAYALLDKAYEQMNAARAARGLAALPRPWTSVSGSAKACLVCHSGIETQRGTFEGKSFAHAPHLQAGRLACDACHRPHAERAPGEVVRFGATACTECHHGTTPRPVTVEACGTCHGDIRTKTIPSWRGPFVHSTHLEAGLECSGCHAMKKGEPRPDKAVCATCHEEK